MSGGAGEAGGRGAPGDGRGRPPVALPPDRTETDGVEAAGGVEVAPRPASPPRREPRALPAETPAPPPISPLASRVTADWPVEAEPPDAGADLGFAGALELGPGGRPEPAARRAERLAGEALGAAEPTAAEPSIDLDDAADAEAGAAARSGRTAAHGGGVRDLDREPTAARGGGARDLDLDREPTAAPGGGVRDLDREPTAAHGGVRDLDRDREPTAAHGDGLREPDRDREPTAAHGGGLRELDPDPPAALRAPAAALTAEPTAVERTAAGAARREPLDLPLVARALALLFAEVLAVGIGLGHLLLGDGLLAFVTKNDVGRGLRRALLLGAGGPALALVAVLGVLVLLRRGPSPKRLYDLGLRLAPALLCALVPSLLLWKAWKTDDVSFLLLVVLVGLGGRGLFEAALRAPPVFPERLRVRLRLRWPAALRAWSPPAIVLLAIVGYVVFFAYHTIAYHRNLHSNSFDLGLENNLLWNLLHGNEPFHASPMFGPKGTHLGHHATFVAYALVPFYALWPRPEMLLVMQAVLMGAAALPLFLFARRHVPAATAAAVAVCYLLFPPLHGAALYDFHYLSIGPFFIWWTVFLVDSGRVKSALAMGLLTLSVREDVAAGLGAVGAYMLFVGHKPRAALALAVAGGGYFIAMKLFVMPLIAAKQTFTYMFKDLIPAGEKGFGGVIQTVLGNPAFALDSIVDKKKLAYGLQYLAPLIFLPLRRPAGLFLFFPAFFFTLLSTGYAPLIQTSFQYTAHWTAPLFVGVVMHLAWMEKRAADGPPAVAARPAIPRQAAVAAMGLATVLCSYQFGAIFQQNTARGGFEAYSFGTNAKELERRDALDRLIAQIPPDARVVSSEKIVPQVSSREQSYTLRIGVFDAEYMLIEPTAEGNDGRKNLQPQLEKGAFGVIAHEGPFYLLQRGAPTEGNAEIQKIVGRSKAKGK